MNDIPPPPPPNEPPPMPKGSKPPGYGAQGGADVWGDDTNGRAGFGNRLGSYVLDVVLYGTVMVVLVSIGSFMLASELSVDWWADDDGVRDIDGGILAGAVLLSVLGPLLVIIVYVLQLGRTGQTWGRRIVSNKVIRVDNGDVPGIGRALGRELFAWIVSASILYLGYLWMIWDGDRQTWHDKVAGTVVVRSR
ncbi:MAG: hypothetical protein CL433_03365 [Acidimicrobiaceae bacterium]|nr:hypothetical protein [Acidimicrobiaceae bacterium]HAB58887.1 hypothetical protein [Acidimicrobiaceae bacterium]